MVFFCKASCAPRDPATYSVSIDSAAIAAQEAARREQEAEAERLRVEEEQRRLEAEAAEQARLQEEEERRLREEEEAREQARLAEEARLREEERLRQEQEEEARRVEAERLRAEQAKKERQEAISSFCTRHGFSNLNEPRRAGCTVFGATSTYALLQAAELGDAKTVEMMLQEGASLSQQNSSKKTAEQLAQKKNKGGSHDAVLQVIRNSTAGGA